jgi:predicted O-methyltransferase YrrM
VLLDPAPEEGSTEALKELNDYIASRDDLYKSLVPLRDGLFMVQKK